LPASATNVARIAGAPTVETSQSESRPSLALGAALILVAALFIVFAKDIPRTGLAGNTDPGPRALPLAMAIAVGMGGLIESMRAVLIWRQHGEAVSTLAPKLTPTKTIASTQTSYKNFAVLTGTMLVYLLALSWLGFQISTLLFSSVVLIWLGARWWSALLASLVVVIVVRILFEGMFHVRLPPGAFNLAF
jgi:hypothetical protein